MIIAISPENYQLQFRTENRNIFCNVFSRETAAAPRVQVINTNTLIPGRDGEAAGRQTANKQHYGCRERSTQNIHTKS